MAEGLEKFSYSDIGLVGYGTLLRINCSIDTLAALDGGRHGNLSSWHCKGRYDPVLADIAEF